MINKNKSKKIFLLYSFIVFGFFIFLSVMLLTSLKSRNIPSLYAEDTSKAERSSIISADGFHLAITKKVYKAIVNTRYIDPQKKELFVQLFSIYSGIDSKIINDKLNKKKGVVVLSYDIAEKQAQYLKQLSHEFRKYKVFMEILNKRTGVKSTHGLSIIESGESREYPYGKLLTPVIGYPHKQEDDGYTKISGVKGLEKRFDVELSARQNASSKGSRDINSYIILNKDSFTKAKIDGLNIELNIPVSLQIRVEKICDEMQIELDAQEIMVAVMETKTGKIKTLASSNRFFPKDIQKSDYGSLRSGMIEYSFEPGSVLKVITFALLLDKGLINPYDLVNGHNGRFKMGKKVITDEHKFDWLSAENVIMYSSNIGIAQLAQKLSGDEFYTGLLSFGFSQKSTSDLIYEKSGSIPSGKRLDNEIYKATCSYGYGIRANLMQLIRAYSAFNNNGRIVKPRIVNNFLDEFNRKIEIEEEEQVQVIKSSTAQRVNQILVKTVNEGTGIKAITPGLVVGGKTGTSHIVENGKYVKKYNTSFMGFANDKDNSYTIGIIVIQPKTSHFAAQTAVPVAKKVIDTMVEEGFLTASPVVISDEVVKENIHLEH